MIRNVTLPQEIGLLSTNIISLRNIFVLRNVSLIDKSSIYCFWWIGSSSAIKNSRRSMKVKGPSKQLVDIHYEFWHPRQLNNISLYIGKTTNTKRRISQHILLKEENRVYKNIQDNIKPKPKTTSCQLRTGIEFIFPNEQNPKEMILQNVGLSYIIIEGNNATSSRFYLEDLAIGFFRPWFNLDSER